MKRSQNRTCTVYGMKSSLEDRIRYVGQTFYDLKNRLRRHLQEARLGNQTPRSRWIRKVQEAGGIIEIVPIELNAIWNEAEIRWIAYYRGVCPDLLNITAGGQGCDAGVPKSPETRRRMSDASRAKWRDPAIRERNLAGIRRSAKEGNGLATRIKNLQSVRDDPVACRAMREKIKAATQTEEFRQKMREHAIRQMSDPEMRERINQKNRDRFKNDPEARKKSAEGARKGWADPEKRAKRIEALRAAKRRGKPVQEQLVLEL